MAEHEGRGIRVLPGDGVSVENPIVDDLTFKVRGEQTNGALSAFESIVAPGEGPPCHVHEAMDEVLYVLDGSFRVRLDNAVEDAPAGTFVFIPRGVAHTWQNVGDGPGRFLVVMMPAGMEQFFDRFAQVTDDASKLEAFRTLGEEVAMQVVGPPLAVSDARWRTLIGRRSDRAR